MLRLALGLLVLGALPAAAQVTAANPIPPGSDTLLLPEVRMRDVAILPQPETGVYHAASSDGRSMRAYVSRDLAG